MRLRVCFYILAASYLFWCTGCAPANNSQMSQGPPAAGGHDHDHHGHSHASHAPHDGHLIEVGNEEYHLEWTHDDANGKVTIYVLDGGLKNDVKIPAKELEIKVKIGDQTSSFKLAAMNATGDPPMASEFQAIDKSLIEGIRMAGHGVVTTTTLDIGGKSYTVEFKH